MRSISNQFHFTSSLLIARQLLHPLLGQPRYFVFDGRSLNFLQLITIIWKVIKAVAWCDGGGGGG